MLRARSRNCSANSSTSQELQRSHSKAEEADTHSSGLALPEASETLGCVRRCVPTSWLSHLCLCWPQSLP